MAGAILHIDDDPRLPEGFARALQREGYELLQTADAEEAIRWVEERRPVLVLMELLLARCDGLDLLEGIRSRGDDPAGIPVVVVTRAPRLSGLYGHALALGVRDFLSKPVLASQLLASVRELAPGLRPPDPLDLGEAPPPEPSGPAPAGLSGDLGETPLPELLRRLHQRGATGVLIASRGRARVGVQLRNGSPVAVSSSRGAEAFEDFLLRTGRIDRDQHRRVAAGVARGTAQAREILAALRVLSDEEIAAARRVRAEEPLLEVFAWTEGSYRFSEERRLRSDVALELERDPSRLILEAVLAASPPAQVRDRLHKRAPLYVSSAEGSESTPERLPLTPEQRRRLAALDGSGTLAELLASKAFDERLLYGLWVAGRIELHAAPVLLLMEELGGEGTDADADRAGGIDEPEVPTSREARPEAPVSREAPPEVPESLDAPPQTPADDAPAALPLAASLRALAQRVLASDDFAVLDLPLHATDGQIRAAYERILAQVPAEALRSPDPEIRERARRIRARVEEVYQHLKDPETRRAYALLRQEEEQDRGAEASAARALEAERSFRKGERLLEEKRHGEAVEAFGMAAHLDPNQGEYLAHLGYALYLSNPRESVVQRESMEHIANGIKRSPDREMPYVFLGRLLRAKGDLDTARKIFRRALKIKPDCHPALQELRLLELREQKGKGLLSRLWKR